MGNPSQQLVMPEYRGKYLHIYIYKSAPESGNVVKKASKWVPIEYPSSLEEFLNRLCVKRLQYQIRTCLPMFAAHLVASEINISVI